MWMKMMLCPDTFKQGVAEAGNRMRLAPAPSAPNKSKPAGKEMPFVEYFNNHCAEQDNNFTHLINTLALAGHFMHYFTNLEKIKDLPLLADSSAVPMDYELAELLKFHPNSVKTDQWSSTLLLATLLHDLGKTLAYRRDIFNCAQHGNKGYLLYHEIMHLRPNLKPTPKNPGKFLPAPQEMYDYQEFLDNNGFTSLNEKLQIHMTVQELILFHDRLGVWQTGESGVRPVLEALEELEKLDKKYFNGKDFKNLAFLLFVLSMADMMASIPDPLEFPNRYKIHPLTAIDPGTTDSERILQRFLTSWKGVEMIRLLPNLLEPDFIAFYKDAEADIRLYRMIINAMRNEQAVSVIWSMPDAERLILESVRKNLDVKHIDPVLKDLLHNYGVWDYALDRLGDPLYKKPPGTIINIISAVNVSFFNVDDLKKIVDRFVTLLADWLIGFRKQYLPDSPIINLEFKNHEYPYLYISPAPEII